MSIGLCLSQFFLDRDLNATVANQLIDLSKHLAEATHLGQKEYDNDLLAAARKDDLSQPTVIGHNPAFIALGITGTLLTGSVSPDEMMKNTAALTGAVNRFTYNLAGTIQQNWSIVTSDRPAPPEAMRKAAVTGVVLDVAAVGPFVMARGVTLGKNGYQAVKGMTQSGYAQLQTAGSRLPWTRGTAADGITQQASMQGLRPLQGVGADAAQAGLPKGHMRMVDDGGEIVVVKASTVPLPATSQSVLVVDAANAMSWKNVVPNNTRALPRNEGHLLAGSITEGGTGTALSGHGAKFLDDSLIVVPEGTAITLPRPGIRILDRTGQYIEKGDWEGLANLAKVDQRVAKDVTGMTTWLPGAKVPEYTLFAPDKRINLFSNSRTVNQPTPLSQILEPNQGCIQWGVCTEFLNFNR